MAKKDKAKAPAASASAAASSWTCADCEQENDAADTACAACDVPKPAAADSADTDRYAGFVAGRVLEVGLAPGKTALWVCHVDVGAAEPLTIVTSANNLSAGTIVVVATCGSLVNGDPVKKATVGGVKSEGMIADSPMLGWTGGGAGAAAILPSGYSIGTAPPPKRPRLDGLA